jgi:hypothetical protein
MIRYENSVHENPDTENREIMLASSWAISTTESGEKRLTVEFAIGEKLVSTGHGACTPVGALRDWEKGMHTGYLTLPVMEDVTGSIVHVSFPPSSPHRH